MSGNRGRRRALIAAGALVLAGASVPASARVGSLAGTSSLTATATATATGASAAPVIVFNGEDNRLNAYDHATGVKQTVIPSASDDPVNGKDINAQICFDPSAPRRFIAGEDTGQPNPPQGWGYFELHGDHVGVLSATQVGKLTPTYNGELSNAENYGCGFLSDGRLVTTDVGNQLPHQPGTGQLIVWFPPFDRFEVPYCKIDTGIPTAGGIYIGPDDSVYVASARQDLAQKRLPAVYRYHGNLPTGPDAAGGCGRTDATGAPLVSDGRVIRDVFISDLIVLTPSGIAPSGHGTVYVSSVFNGVIAEYGMDGLFRRIIMAPPIGGQALPGGTPFGIGVAPDGTIYYADIGVLLAGPAADAGSVQKIEFVHGVPLPPKAVDEGLQFPDGIGILEIREPA